MDTFIFEREEQTLLECMGERTARITTEKSSGPGAKRWHHLQIVHTDDNSDVLAIQYLSHCPGEQIKGYAWRGSPSELAAIIEAFSPAGDVKIPATGKDSEAVESIKQELEERFDVARQKILRHLAQ